MPVPVKKCSSPRRSVMYRAKRYTVPTRSLISVSSGLKLHSLPRDCYRSRTFADCQCMPRVLLWRALVNWNLITTHCTQTLRWAFRWQLQWSCDGYEFCSTSREMLQWIISVTSSVWISGHKFLTRSPRGATLFVCHCNVYTCNGRKLHTRGEVYYFI